MQVIIETSSRHIFCNYTQVWRVCACTNKANNVFMLDLPKNCHFLSKLIFLSVSQMLRSNNFNCNILTKVNSTIQISTRSSCNSFFYLQ
uniref:Tyrosine-protein kinase Src42A-like isoform X2 n=2 Tax=Rhizophora mucronata TaxID=61149 RepID=A0A2P2LTB6_RHIMU